MRSPALLLLIVAAAGGCSRSGSDAPETMADSACAGDGVVVTDAWVRAAPSGQGTSAAYFTICNAGDDEKELIGVDTAAAATVELHETTRDENGIASMEPVTSVQLGSKIPVAFAPGGRHVMLIGVTEALAEGGAVPLTLHFADGSQVAIEAAVRAADAAAHDQH